MSMAVMKPEPLWVFDPSTYFVGYGLLPLGGKWAVVKARNYNREDYDVITDWVDKPTAIGFLKLLKEK